MRLAIGSMLLAIATAANAKLKVGDPAPHYVVRTFDRAEIDSTALAGKVVVINRWATWCGPCRKELPALDTYFRRHEAEGLRIYAVTIEDSLPQYKLKPLAAVLSFPLATSVKGGFPVLGGVPTSYVVDRHGIVRYAEADMFDDAKLDAVIGPLLAEK